MATTTWPDVSEHNGDAADNRMRSWWFSFRVNDGTYRDRLCAANYIWARRSKRLVGYFAYNVWPRSMGWCKWQDSFAAFCEMIGRGHHPRMVIMDDVETWSRDDLRKDFSRDLEAKRKAEVAYLHAQRPAIQRRTPLINRYYLARDNKRVIGYGNRGDLETMARHVNWPGIILADYSDAPTPSRFLNWRVIGRQYTDHGNGGTWAHCDMNRASMGPITLARVLGIRRIPSIRKR